jgi:subtilisin family serine protease
MQRGTGRRRLHVRDVSPFLVDSPPASRQVVFKLKTTEPARRALRALTGPEAGRREAARARTPLGSLLTSSMTMAIEPLFPAARATRARAGERIVMTVGDDEEPELAGLNVLTAHSLKDAKEACARLESDARVEYAHVIQERFLYAPRRARPARKRRGRAPLDPLLNRQWGLVSVQLVQAQRAAGFREASDITIAVIDTGVDAGHADLEGVVFDEQNFTTGPLRDTKGHGTHVIGIIGARRNNAVGISGVCQSRRIMSLKALGPYDGPGYYRAIRYATDNGARVINLSLGGGHDPTEETLIRRAINRRVVVVAAMGNEFEEGNPTSYPAAIAGVISVGATTEVDRRASFSNTGPHIDLAAPGVNILSTVPTYPSELAETTDYDSWPGTSMATPFVAATAALILAKRPDATPAAVRRALTGGADRVPGQRGFNHEVGYGRLNVKNALARS